MKFLFKLIFGTSLVIVLAIAAVVIILVYINPNDYKDMITDKLKEQTGRDIRINGDINLSYYPWLGLDVEGISIGNVKGFGDKLFLKTKTVKVRAKLLPLLRKKLEMDTLVLHDATVNLVKNADGVTNWDDLVKTEKKNEASPLTALMLGGIDIKDANIHWHDKQQNLEYKITDANISTGELKLDESIDLSVSLNVSASKPALSAAIDFKGTIAYEDNGDVLSLKPLLLEANVKGTEIPDGQALVKLSSEISIDLDKGIAQVNVLDLAAFDTHINGQVNVSNIDSGKLEVAGKIDIKGKDLPQLLKIVEIEPLASQITRMTDKSFDIGTIFSVDTKRNDVDVSKLAMTLLGNKINAEIYARNLGTESPAAKGKIKASGTDFPALIKIASQFTRKDNQDLKSLSAKLGSATKPFDIQTDFDVDLKSGLIDIRTLSVKALGMTASGKINGKQLNSDAPEIKGELKANGKDLPLLVSISTQLKGLAQKDISALSKKLSSASKSFNIKTTFSTDPKTNTVSIPVLSIEALGTIVNGNLKAKKINSDLPAFSGELKAKGSNLPLLMQIAKSMSGDDSQLINNLGKLQQKAFEIDTQFDTDIASGKIDLSSLNINAFGFKVNANLKGNNIQKSNGNMQGKIAINSQNPKPLLTAMGQADVAQVLKSININTDLNGNTSDLILKPFSMEGIFSGKNIPDPPVTLSVQADSKINLDKETFNLNGLQIKGLGLDVKGNIKASQFKTAPTISGQIAVAPFDLRQFIKSLNKDLPETADTNVLKHVAVTTSFTGTTTSISLKELKAELDETRLQGDINIKRISPLDIEFDLGVDKLNADRYLPLQAEAKTVMPEAVGVPTGLPIETLQAIKINGDFVMEQLLIANAKLSDMKLSIRADKGDIKLAPAAAKLYQGSYVGDIHLDTTSKLPKLTINTKLTGVEAEPLLKDIVGAANAKGTANISLALSSNGVDINTLRHNLSGTGDILFEKGAFIGVDIKNVLHQVEIMIETKSFGKPDLGEETEFNKLTARLDIHSGIINNNDLLMLGSGFKVTGKGMLLNLHDETWKYTLVAKADATRVRQGEKTFNIGGHEVPVKCKGKIAEKNCNPDISAIASTFVKKAVIDKLFEEVGIKRKGIVPAPVEPGGQQMTPQKPTKDIKEKVIKDIFDKLF